MRTLRGGGYLLESAASVPGTQLGLGSHVPACDPADCPFEQPSSDQNTLKKNLSHLFERHRESSSHCSLTKCRQRSELSQTRGGSRELHPWILHRGQGPKDLDCHCHLPGCTLGRSWDSNPGTPEWGVSIPPSSLTSRPAPVPPQIHHGLCPRQTFRLPSFVIL